MAILSVPFRVAIVLAGGASSRIGGNVPKFALTVGGTSLLSRQLGQLAELHAEVLISVRDKGQAIHASRAAASEGRPPVRIVLNPGHAAGPNHALRHAIQHLVGPCKSLTVTMGDLWFATNPFRNLEDTSRYLVIAPRSRDEPTVRLDAQGRADDITWPAHRTPPYAWAWAGAYGAPHDELLGVLGTDEPVPQLEEVIVERLIANAPVITVNAGQAFNVNEAADLQRLCNAR